MREVYGHSWGVIVGRGRRGVKKRMRASLRFGWVCKGQYKGQNVICQVLKEECTTAERQIFVDQSLKWNRKEHPNVLRLIGVSMGNF